MAELDKWLDYLSSNKAAATILADLGVEESSELKLLDHDDVEKIAAALPKVVNGFCFDLSMSLTHVCTL